MPADVRVLIDPAYVKFYPFHLVPTVVSGLSRGRLSALAGRWMPDESTRFLRDVYGRGADQYDGMEVDFTYTGIFDEALNIRPQMLERYAARRRSGGWPIVTYHATFADGSPLFRRTEMSLCRADERDIRGLRNHIVAASEISGPGSIIAVHMGNTTDHEGGMRNVLRSLDAVVRLAEDRGVILALENMTAAPPGHSYLGADYRDLQRVLRAMASPSVKVCFDWGHANHFAASFLAATGRPPDPVYLATFGYCREMIRELGPEIVHAHIHYNAAHTVPDAAADRHWDQHQPLNRLPDEERPAFEETLELLLRETRVTTLTLELFPSHYFGVVPMFRTGSNRRDQRESAAIVRQMLGRIPEAPRRGRAQTPRPATAARPHASAEGAEAG